ncbi:MAG: hypothetical protein PUC47_11320 [Oscillospiraceae bacterium]|nr:hypothetical protein [Oscillospiraceae bacterium]
MSDMIASTSFLPDGSKEQFLQLTASVRASFDRAVEKESLLFTTDAENLYDLLLDGLPDELKQTYRCGTCRQFVDRFGALVTITDEGETCPVMWDGMPDFFESIIQPIRRAVKKARVTGVFVTSAEGLGAAELNGWPHLAVKLPQKLVYADRLKTAEQQAAALAEEHRLLGENVGRYKRTTLQTALNLLRSESFDRGEKVLGAAEWFDETLQALQSARDQAHRAAILWKRAAAAPAGFCHVSETMLGTLLDDIEAGRGAERIRERFARKMDPTVYQRPQARPSEGNVARAEEIMEKLNLTDSMQRRFARIEELELLWKPAEPEAKPKKGFFSDLRTKKKAESTEQQVIAQGGKMTWEKFQRTVLPSAKKIEFFACKTNYSAIVTAVHPDAPPLLQWDNEACRCPFNWYVYKNPSQPDRWNLKPFSYVEVTGITLQPSMWHGGFEHQGKSVFFLLKGAKDSSYENSGCALFPEMLRSELHEVRSTIEAWSNTHSLSGYDEATACGFRLEAGNEYSARFRVTTDLGVTEYILDRWD